MSKMKKFAVALKYAVALCVLVIILVWMGGGFHEKAQPEDVTVARQPLPEGATTAQVLKILEQESAEAVGTVQASHKTAVASKLLATVKEIPVKAGDGVREGQVLVRLDDRDVTARLAQAREQLTAADSALTNAEKELSRYDSMLKEGATSQQEFDNKKSAFEVARAKKQQAEQAVKEAEVYLTYTEIKAPVEGRVVDKLVDAGDTATPGQTLLNLYDPKALRLEASVPASLATELKIGQPLSVTIDNPPLKMEGAIEEIVPQADVASRSFLVKVALPHDERLFTGSYGRLSIPSGERVRLCIPEAAVERSGQLEFVTVVKKDGTLEHRFIKTGIHREQGKIEALSGVAADERILIPAGAEVSH